jgi:hypothetical protein
MKKTDEIIRAKLAFELLETELKLLRISQIVQNDIKNEIEKVVKYKRQIKYDQNEFTTSFENFDQKANQLFNILSTVLKSMKEMKNAVTRNCL